MAVIYKFTLYPVPGTQEIDMPLGTILDVQMQAGKIALWMLDAARYTKASFMLVETGQEFVQREYRYVTTLQPRSGYVLHLWLKDRG